MANYPYYIADSYSDFNEFLEGIGSHGDRIAFRDRNNEYSYSKLYRDIKKCQNYFCNYSRTYFRIDIENQYFFCVMFFSIVTTGNVAVLAESIDLEYMGLSDFETINMDKVFPILNNCMIGEIIKSKKDDVCVIACSSGTTSKKKGVMLTQENLLSNMLAELQMYRFSKNDIYLNVIPYTHLFGLVIDLFGPLNVGATICMMKKPLLLFEELRYFKPTSLNITPAIVASIDALLKSSGDLEYSTGGSLKKIMCGGAKLDESFYQDFESYGIKIYAAYGMTECSPGIALNRDDYYRKGSVGLIAPCCRVKIVDGEILVSGKNVMKGYLNDEEATDKVLIDGWLHTGDLGYLDEDGFLFLLGRKTNLIIFENGKKICSEVLESELEQINGVVECFVYGEEYRRKMHIIIKCVTNTNHDEVENKIKDFLRKKDLLVRSRIIMCDNLLERNILGKKIRSSDRGNAMNSRIGE